MLEIRTYTALGSAMVGGDFSTACGNRRGLPGFIRDFLGLV